MGLGLGLYMQIFPCHLKEGSDYFFKNGTVLFVKKLMKSLLLRVKETTGLTQLRIFTLLYFAYFYFSLLMMNLVLVLGRAFYNTNNNDVLQ